MLRPVPACWTRWFQVGPCFVGEMVAGHCGSSGDTESGSRFQLHSGAPASGQGGKEEWLGGCWSPHFPGSDQGRTAKTQGDIPANHCFLFLIMNKPTHPLQILLRATLWIWQRHFKHPDYPAAISLLCMEENCLKGAATSHARSASIRQFYFSGNWTQTDFKSPIKFFQSFNLA